MIVTNEPRQCVVRISHSATDVEDKSGVTAVGVRRREAESDVWELICKANILDASQENQYAFVVTDKTARSLAQYVYQNVIYRGSNETYGPEISLNVVCDGVLAATAREGISLLMNVEYTARQNYSMNYVRPFYSRYPHSVQNGEANYATGTVKGLINTFSPMCEIEMKNGHDANTVVAFLTNGLPKLIKTHDGRAWYAQIDGESVSIQDGGDYGLVEVSFAWTEIGAVPATLSM